MKAKTAIRILMVEDNPHDAVLVQDVLRNSGLAFHSKCVDNERDFLEGLDHYSPDLILSDHCLTDFGGWNALSVARGKLPDVPFIFFTSPHGEDAAIQAFKGGATDYIFKTRLTDLAPAIKRALSDASERTRRRKAEEALRRSEESFRLMVESVKDYAFYLLDSHGLVASWNNGAERLQGYPSHKILGKPISVFFMEQDAAAGLPERLLREAENQGVTEYQGWCLRKNRSCFWAEVVITALCDGSGRLTGFSKLVHNISEQKSAEERLKAHVSRQAVVAELGQRALLTMDFSDFMNQTAALLARTCGVDLALILELHPGRNNLLFKAGVGWKPGVVGRMTIDASPATHSGFALQSDKPVMFENLARETRFEGAPVLQEHGVISGLNVIIRQRDRPFGLLGVYARDCHSFSDDDVHFVQAVANILSAAIERKRAQEQLRRFSAQLERRVTQRTAQLEAANKELESFSYSVSHDLRTPLRHISGFIEMLERTASRDWDPSSRATLKIIADSAKKMDNLINDLLTLSRMGCSEMRQTKVNMADLVDKVRTELRTEIGKRQVAWVIEELPEVIGDPVLLRQVWMNLICNALKYSRTRPESQIFIGSREEDQETVFWIRDNGVGFDPQYAHKLFGVFQRLHPVREFEGTGIGLAIIRRIVARHGGRTWAESVLGQGATFFFSIPKAGAESG